LKKNYQILIIFDKNISEAAGHQFIICSFPPYPSYVSALPGEIRTNELLHLYLKWYYYLM